MQGRSFEGLNVVPPPTFNEFSITEPNNIVDHFIDSTGVVSWKFFSEKADYEFFEWNMTGTTQEEYVYLMQILEGLEKEVYIADYEELGASACRILVPDYSEIYAPEDLIWDNHNKSLLYREDILNLHKLSDLELENLIAKFEESDLDDYSMISELIGVEFDENSVWGQLTVSELKCLCHLALQNLDEAKELVEMFLAFNDHSNERVKLYRALSTLLDIKLERDYEVSDYLPNMTKMFGEQIVQDALSTVSGELHFPGLSPLGFELSGCDKHQRLIESYEKLQKTRNSKRNS